MPTKTDRAGIILLSTADWDNPYWTNKQHVALKLAARGHKVLYIESMGLRAPTMTGKDASRIWRRLKRGLKKPRQVRPGLWVWSPLSIPLQKYTAVRWLNRMILKAGIGLWSRLYGIRPEILWTYSPLTTRLHAIDRYKTVVYHAVDDISAQPGMPVDLLRTGEKELCASADFIFTTAKNIQETLSPLNSETHYFSNVADFDHFNQALDPNLSVPEDLLAIPEPRIGFVGAIASYKLDFELIRDLAKRHPDWNFVFIGEIGEGDPLTDASSIMNIPNLHFLGGRAYQSLPGYLKGFSVALLPNLINDYTRSMFPMKFFEYLAAGRPVVTANLHALQEFKDVASFATTVDDYEAAIDLNLRGEGAALSKRLDAAREQTYERRTERMMALIERNG